MYYRIGVRFTWCCVNWTESMKSVKYETMHLFLQLLTEFFFYFLSIIKIVQGMFFIKNALFLNKFNYCSNLYNKYKLFLFASPLFLIFCRNSGWSKDVSYYFTSNMKVGTFGLCIILYTSSKPMHTTTIHYWH